MLDLQFELNLTTFITKGIGIAGILIAAVVVKWASARVIRRLVRMKLPRLRQESADQLARRSDTLSAAINRGMGIVIWLVALVTIFSELGVNTGAILATIGVGTIAVGLAAQNIIRDFLHGFFIIIEDWYRVGEVARVAGIAGLVTELNLRRTILRDLDGTVHNIPNSKIELSSNLTRDFARVNLNVPVAYGEDLDRVIAVINDECQQLKEDPAWGADLLTTPQVLRVDNFAESGIELKVLGDTKPIRQWAVMGEIRKRLKARFDREGIEIPWPHRKLYFGQAMGRVDLASLGVTDAPGPGVPEP